MKALFSPNGEWAWVMIQAVVVSATLLLILRQLTLQRNSHVVNTIASLDEAWKSEIMIYSRHYSCSTFSLDKEDLGLCEAEVCTFFEKLGVYRNLNVLSMELIWEIYSYYIENYWQIFQKSITCMRVEYRDYTYYTNFEELYKEVVKINKKKGVPNTQKTNDQLNEFIAGELQNTNFLDDLDQHQDIIPDQ